MRRCVFLSLLLFGDAVAVCADDLFVIQVVDSQTGRGVPQVEVRPSGGPLLMTDSNGFVAINEPALVNENVFVGFQSYGYSDWGQTIETMPGNTVQIAIDRRNRAERLYRVTGAGIYNHSVTAGYDMPIDQPLLNANVKGQDSVQTTIYKDQVFWIWGDTAHENGSYNFRAAGATSELPSQGGLDPSLGVNLNYFKTSSGNTKGMMPTSGPGLVWLDGLFTVHDNSNQERMLAHFIRVDGAFNLYEQGLALFNDTSEIFVKHQNFASDAPITPQGHAFRHTVDGEDYIYFAQSYPNVRVKADWDHVTDISKWEAFTPLQENSRYSADNPPLDLDDEGNLRFGWKKNTDPFERTMLNELVARGHLNRNESPFRLKDHETGQNIDMQRASVQWNEYRQSWIMIGQEIWGSSLIGEIWFAEAPTPEGPWENAVKVVTHSRSGATYSFYNPALHSYFDQDGGRYIYFEGTYTAWLGSASETPLYDYNQVMYRLDLATIPDLFSRPLSGDFNFDGIVDAADYSVWRDGLGSRFDQADFTVWKANFGATANSATTAIIPEPTTILLLPIACGLIAMKKRWAGR